MTTGVDMHFNYFSLFGYVSVVLWILVPVLWALHVRRRPRRWLAHVALAVALLAFLFAKINSVTYVGRIQLDQSAEIAAAQAKQAAARKMAEASRSDNVAKIRFAEDKAGDVMDKGGMDEADLKYMGKINSDAAPAWKQAKKARSGAEQDDSLEAQLGGEKEPAGVTGEGAGKEEEKAPLLMLEKDKDRANRLDGANLQLIRMLILVGLVLVLSDYLRRVNIYDEAYLPLPLPSAWVNALTPLPPWRVRPVPSRRTLPEELAWLIKRGDSFVYMARDPEVARQIPATLPRLGRRGWPVEVIPVPAGSDEINDRFVFETVWYGRASFVVESPDRALKMMGQFMALMAERKATRATVAQTVHIVWDGGMPLDEAWQREFAKLTRATGMSLVVCSAGPASTSAI